MRAFNAPPLDFEPDETAIVGLPPILPRFVVPHLAEKPQDPIIANIKHEATSARVARRRLSWREPISESEHIPQQPAPFAVQQFDDINLLWADAAKSEAGNMVMSWDALRPESSFETRGTPFLSEQEDFTLAAIRHHVFPHLQDPAVRMLDVTSARLFNCLKLTILGTTSSLYAWDQASEKFVGAITKDGHPFLILVDRKDDAITASIIQRFLSIGTLIRRLQILVASIRRRPAQDGPSIHAFAHALTIILTYLCEELAVGPPSDDSQSTQSLPLATIWLYYGQYEEILVSLSHLCCRDEEKSPSDYLTLDSSPAWLLSRIYEHLSSHIEKQSSLFVIASFAYILETSSCDYLEHICQLVGIGEGSRDVFKTGSLPVTTLRDENPDDDINDQGKREDQYPSFFQKLASSLPTAKKSLKILRMAQVDHPIFARSTSVGGVKWVWTEEAIKELWHSDRRTQDNKHTEVTGYYTRQLNPSQQTGHQYPEELASFRKFDLEPGAHLSNLAKSSGLTVSSTTYLRNFLTTFPKSLPPITPTLSNLTSFILTPLIERTTQLSSELLSIFLSESSSLHFQTHLVLLRSYLLLTSHSFKSRLNTALFCDAGDDVGLDIPDFNSTREPRHQSSHQQSGTRPWAVGLAPALTNRETWPPGGADLSFLLRTVIVDSLEHDRAESKASLRSQSARNAILEESEFRLGFAIRDLPTGPGRDRWLNPLSIEALDFLYMDFKPPKPLSFLITAEILSKYHRLFAFILRMMRVENVVCALYRMTKDASKPLFPTLTSSNQLLLHFQFIARSFVKSLTGYVFDTAVRGNFDAFITRLSSNAHSFPDIFSLAKAHSVILDDILFACLLRSGQRAVGDLLRGALAIVLDFGILTGELKRRRLDEYQAAPLLEDYFRQFRDKMIALTRVLGALAEKGSVPSGMTEPIVASNISGVTIESPHGTQVLHHLLIRLDFSDWWSRMQI